MRLPSFVACLLVSSLLLAAPDARSAEVQYYDVPRGAHPHDVAADPRPGGPVWYTAQLQGALGRLDPTTGDVLQIPLAWWLALRLDWGSEGVFWAVFFSETGVGLFTLWLFSLGGWKKAQV